MSVAMEYGPLSVFMLIIVIGGVIASGKTLPGLEEMGRTRRRLLGIFVMEMGGLFASAWTWMIHNQLSTSGASGLCAAEGIVQCGSVIGDPTYSTLGGIPLGAVGILAFGALGWLTLSIFMDMKSDWAKSYLDYAWWLSLAGIPGVLWLVLVELFLVEGAPHICPYCTSVHIAVLGVVAFLFTTRKERDDENIWEISPKKSKEELLAKARKK